MHAKSEKALLNIKEIVREKTTKSITERINHHVVSKVGDNDKILIKSLNESLEKWRGVTSERSWAVILANTARNRTRGSMTLNKSIINRASLIL